MDMKSPKVPDDELARLEKLKSYGVLDTEAEESFDRITRIVAESLGVPIVLVSLIDSDRQWFKSRQGLDAEQTPRELAFCAHAINQNDVFVVNDAQEDERFSDNPLVTGDPNVRFYAGAPLITPEGYKMGTLCAIDSAAGTISDDHKQLLVDLASLVIDEMELRKARQDAVRANELLELKIHELTDTQERLEEQARQMTQLAEIESALKVELAQEVALKDRFFSIIAHDLKSPFTSLLGMSSLLANMSDRLSKEQIVEYTEAIHNSGKKVFALLENLLEWARVQMAHESLVPDTIVVSDLVDESKTLLTGSAESKALSVVSDIPDLKVNADRNMALLVARNLIANAIKFTPKGGRIVISARDCGEMIEVSVSDTGVGIPSEIAEALFAIDQKTTTLGTEGEVGTGLGLPLCKEMIELNGGSIRVDSTIGKGTTFHFTLPKAD